MATITSPPYSFVRFSDQHLNDVDWHERQIPGASLGFSLPICTNNDLAFQFIVDTVDAIEADSICSFPLTSVVFKFNRGAFLGPTLTAAQYNTIPSPEFTFPGIERYRLSPTRIFYYMPSLGGDALADTLTEGDCFQIAISFGDSSLVAPKFNGISNIFLFRGENTDYTTVLNYFSETDEAEFMYCLSPRIKNRVRLPLYLTRPTYPEEQTEYSDSRGATTITKAAVRKVFEVITDSMPGWAIEALRAIWLHDEAFVDVDPDLPQTMPYTGAAVKEGAFDVEYVKYLNYPFGTVNFKLAASPFLMKKDNCGECADYSAMLMVSNITIPAPLPTGHTYNFNLASYINASCCAPLTFSVVSFQSSRILSATILPGNTLRVITRNPFRIFRDLPPLVLVKVECGNITKFISVIVV